MLRGYDVTLLRFFFNIIIYLTMLRGYDVTLLLGLLFVTMI